MVLTMAATLLVLGSCQSTTQRCMEARDKCLQGCGSDDKAAEKGTKSCKQLCDEALDKCMTP